MRSGSESINGPPGGDISPRLVREALDQICADPIFRNAIVLKAFLRFAVESRLTEPEADLKEYIVATRVLGRDPSFDPAHSSIVRTHAVKLRAKLREYYASSGRRSAVSIIFQPGKYSPDFASRHAPDGPSPDDSVVPPAIRQQPVPLENPSAAPDSLVVPIRITQKLGAAGNFIALSVHDQLMVSQPEWLKRYKEGGGQFSAGDIQLHLKFLAGAIEAGSRDSFTAYVLWTARFWQARGFDLHFLEETFARIATHLAFILTPDEYSEAAGYLMRALRESTNGATPPWPPADDAESGFDRKRFASAILKADKRAALELLNDALRHGHSQIDIYVDIVQFALARVGKLWELNLITATQAHMAATAAQYAISGMYPMWPQENATRGQMVVTGVSGELHEIGATMLSDAMEAKGWRVRFLGSNVPLGDVLQVIDGNPVDVLCISTTLTANLPATAELVLSIREQRKRRHLKIVAGGAAYSDSPHFPAQLGVLGGALDLRHAVRLLCP